MWFGSKELPAKDQAYLDTWKKFCPDYQIIRWDETNFDVESCYWVKQALEHKKYAFASDAIRMYALATMGGIYLDTDVYLLKSFDELLHHDAFMGYESGHNLWLGPEIMGACENNDFFKYLYSYYTSRPLVEHGKMQSMSNVMAVVELTRRYYNGLPLDGKRHTLTQEGKPSLAIYPHDYFFAKDYMTGKTVTTENSVCVHDVAMVSSWWSKGQKRGAAFAQGARKVVGRHIFKCFERGVKHAQTGAIRNSLKKYPLEIHFGATNSDTMIEVSHLAKSFEDIQAVNDISFSVKRGALFTFLGVNGAGKSTTINILCSLLTKDKGIIKINGLDLDKHASQIKNKIGIVFQGSVLDNKLTVLDNLKSRAALYPLDGTMRKKRIAEVTNLLDLGDILKRKYEKLSGGQRRRVDIARALIHEPKILFLDEPTTGLDPGARIAVWQTIEKLVKEKSLTVFLTTHYMEEVTRADHVIILDSGRIVAEGTPDDLKSRFTTDFLRIIAPSSQELDSFLEEQHKKFSYRNNAYYVEFATCTEAHAFIAKHTQFTDFEILKGDMDDVFLSVTGKKLKET